MNKEYMMENIRRIAGELVELSEMLRDEGLPDDLVVQQVILPPVIPEKVVGNKESAMEYKMKCSTCGIDTVVPFKPRGDYPVYCKECYIKRIVNGIRVG